MTLAEAEADISDMLKDASANYEGDPEAMRLRTMHLAYEAVKQSGGTLVIPSAFSEGFTDPDTAEALAKAREAELMPSCHRMTCLSFPSEKINKQPSHPLLFIRFGKKYK